MNAPININEPEKLVRQNETFHEYLRILGRHKRSILVLTLLFAMLGALSSALQVPLYRATSKLLIDRETERPIQGQALYGQSALNYEYYFTQHEVLRTRPLAEKTVDKVGVDKILGSLDKKSKLSLDRILPWRNKSVGTLSPEQKRETAINLVQNSLVVEPIKNTQLVRVGFIISDPKLAVELSNQHADAYIENTLEARLEMLSKASSWLETRIGTLKTKVDASSNRLKDFMQREGIAGNDATALPSQGVTMMAQQVATARAQRLDLEAIYQQVKAARASSTLETVSGLGDDELVSELRQRYNDARQNTSELGTRYGPDHPKMVSAKNEESSARKSLKSALENAAIGIIRQYESARSVEAQMQAQLGSAQSQLQLSSRKQVEYQLLSREAAADQLVYDKFAAQAKETNELANFKSANARIVELALDAGAPVFPKTNQTIISAALLGLILSILLAVLLEHLDNTIKSAEDVERRLQLPVLGLVPQLKANKEASPMRYFLEHPKTAFSESLRTIRTGVLLSTLDKQHRRVLVTSSVPGEGKTTISLNLAQAMSQMNKVLLIDADLRRPAVARAFSDGKPHAGLSQFISGEAKLSECVHQLAGSNTYVMTAGVIPPNPLELISSNRFSEALDNLGKVFDYIVIDCAPALAVSDALVLSRLVDGVIYVVRSDHTPYQAAQSGIKRMQRVDAPLIGVVLNRVGERSTGYGYGRYSYYADGYQQHYEYYTSEAKTK
jgi:polysaccharide biosynthesis transport protein